MTEIGQGLFAFSTISTATIAADVETVGLGAFICCYSLNSVTIGSKVTTIGDYAFQFDKAIKEVHITDINSWLNIDFGSSDSNPCYYGGSLFIDDKPVTDLIIPDGITQVETHHFIGFNDVTSLTLPASLTSISNDAGVWFNDLRELHVGSIVSWLKLSGIDVVSATPYDLYVGDDIVQNLVIPEGVTSIRTGAFAYCRSITSVDIPASVTEIGKGAFYGCDSLTSANFEVKDGWRTYDTEIELPQETYFSDPSSAAEVLLTGAWLHRSTE